MRESVEGSEEDGEGEQEVMGMRCQCWLLKTREVTVTLVTSLARSMEAGVVQKCA